MSTHRLIALSSSLLATILWLAVGSCDSGGGKRPLGAVCSTHAECASGVCGNSVCLDPAGDADEDTLLNLVEAQLKTNPTNPDSDGDGVGDEVEVGDVQAPLDTDGDGKIDAIESNTQDKDGDCLVDQRDPRDGVSDPPSAEFPDACGGQGCGPSPLAGTCAEALGQMIFECFAPTGACRYMTSMRTGDAGYLVWDNNATINWVLGAASVVGTVRAPDGEVCGTVSQNMGTAGVQVAPVTLSVGIEGPTFHVVQLEGELQIMCPDERVVTLQDAEADRFSTCAGLTADQVCETITPRACQTDIDCQGTGLCCRFAPDIPEAGRACMEVEVCPESEPR